jgi:hypothetical protein
MAQESHDLTKDEMEGMTSKLGVRLVRIAFKCKVQNLFAPFFFLLYLWLIAANNYIK